MDIEGYISRSMVKGLDTDIAQADSSIQAIQKKVVDDQAMAKSVLAKLTHKYNVDRIRYNKVSQNYRTKYNDYQRNFKGSFVSMILDSNKRYLRDCAQKDIETQKQWAMACQDVLVTDKKTVQMMNQLLARSTKVDKDNLHNAKEYVKDLRQQKHALK